MTHVDAGRTIAPQAIPRDGSHHLAPDCRGSNFYELDPGLRQLLELYLDEPLRRHLEPHWSRLGELAAGRLDELAAQADRNGPVLHARDRYGRDRDWIEYDPAYREMERLAFGELGLHAMTHRGGVLGWPEPFPPLAKYAFQYLFVQAEFGLMCPISVTDTSITLLRKFASPELKERFLPRMLSQDLDELWKGAQFMTEKSGGSDVGALETVAVRDGDQWRLWGEKWFCSHADGDVALLLARPESAGPGTRGLGLFAMPREIAPGERNAYRILRLKDKLGTRSMASGEIRLEGAVAYQIGDVDRGFKQMMEQVNLSRLSHGVRAAGMMRRSWHEAVQVARHRKAFGRRLLDLPLLRRELLGILLPTEQALSVSAFAADLLRRDEAGESEAGAVLRLVTPLLKYRACRDNLAVATASMEVRGGNGYVEEWAHARLVRDAQLGVLWEGTSNIIALDVLQRAVAKLGAHEVLGAWLHGLIDEAELAPAPLRERLRGLVDRATAFAAEAAAQDHETQGRRVAAALYDTTSAVLFAWEAAAAAALEDPSRRDARRLLLCRLVLDRRLASREPFGTSDDRFEDAALDQLMSPAPVALERAATLAAG